MKKIGFLILRYILAVVFAFVLPFFYLVLRPTTIYPIYLITNLIYGSSIRGIILSIGSHSIEFIDACIAGSAYLFLLILNLITPNPFKKRIKILVVDFFLFYIFNLARILVLIILLVNNNNLFDITHKITWYGISTIFVVLIWFFNIKLLNLKDIPIYSDIKFILNQIRLSQKKK